MKHHTNKLAFTLAEILITLGIIGVVAALLNTKKKFLQLKLNKPMLLYQMH